MCYYYTGVTLVNSNTEKIMLGIIFIILGILYLLDLPAINKVDEFSFTLAAFFLSISTLFTEPLKNNEKISTFNILKYSMYFLGFVCLFLLPQFDNYKFITKTAESINYIAFLMFSLGITFISIFFNDKDTRQLQKKLEQDKQEAVLNERKKITEELYKRINKNEN
jgi:hypothetical protein